MFFSNSAESKLKSAFELYSQYYCETLPSSEKLIEITFSKKFEKKMKKLLTVQKRVYYRLINTVGKRVAIIILSLIIGLTATTFGVKAIREAVLEFITQIFDTHTDVSITLDDVPLTIDFNKTEPQYVPEGFNVSRNSDFENSYLIVYTDYNNNPISYSQKLNDGSLLSADTQGVEIQKVYINSLEEIIYESKGFNTLVFGDENYFFTLYGKVAMEELIRMAESIPIN